MNIQNGLKFLLPLVLGSFLNLNAQQSVLSSFNGYADIVNVVQDPDATGADSVFTLQINNFAGSPRFQPFGPWIAADVQVGCVVWVDCSRLVIKEVIYASYSSMEVKVTVPQPDWLLGVSVPLINTRCAVVYEDQYLLTALPAPADGNAGALSGINNSLFACMLNHYSQALLTTKNSVNEITDYVAGLDTVPSESPIPNIGETWRNSVGQLFYSDGTQWLTDKEVLFTNYGLEGLPSNLYKLGLDTLGQDTLYVSNNGIFNRFQAGLVYKEGFGINIYATDSIEVDTNQIATQYDLSQIEVKIDTFRVNSPNLELSLKNDNEPVKTVPLSSIVTGGGGLTGNGVAGYLPQYNTSTTLDTTGLFWNATTGRLGIGTASPTSRLTVSGRIEPVNIGNSIFIGENTGRVDDLSDNRNIFIGWRAGYNNTTGFENLFEGYEAGYSNIDGSRNIFQGAYAGRQNTSGGGNIFQGYEAGYSSTSSLSNLVQGNQAGRGLTTGYQNIIQGQQAGFSIAGGFRNVLQGFQAGYTTTGSGNLMQGYQAGEFTTTGSGNVFQGFDAAVNNTTGSNNVINGAEAGKFIGTGTTANTILNNSIIIGYDSRSLADNQTNQVVIGYQGRGLGSNTTAIGNSSTTQTWLGGSLTLGTQITPAARLHVVGSSALNSASALLIQNSGPTSILDLRNDGQLILSAYPNTLNSTGSPVNVLSTSSTGVVESHPVSEIVTSGGGLTGNGVAGYLPQYNTASTLDTSGVFWNATTGRLGIRTDSPDRTLDVLGDVEIQNPSTSYEGGILSADLLTTGTGSGWTGTSFATGYKHDSLTTPLTSSFTPIVNRYYLMIMTVSGRTAGTISYTFGGFTFAATSINSTFNNSFKCSTTSPLVLTPTATFDGTVVFNIYEVTGGPAAVNFKNNAGTITNQMRISANTSSFFMGNNAGAKNTALLNFAIGAEALANNITGTRNFALGSNALRDNTGGSYTTAIGQDVFVAGYQLGNNYNVGIGTNIGSSTATGPNNIFIGGFLGNNITGANNNIGIGYMSFRAAGNSSGNLILGHSTNRVIGTYNNNILLGNSAIFSNWNGSNNVAVGLNAGRYIGATGTNPNSSPDNSIFIGHETRSADSTNTNQVVIGYQAVGLGSNTTVLGNSTTTQTWLGGSLTLGTQITPLARLHVAGASALNTDRAVLITNNATTPLNLFEVRNAGEIYFNQYPNTLNTSGNPVNVLSTGADGVLQSHPISEVISSGGAITSILGGTGISVSTVSGTSTITNTAPDQTVSITGAGINTVTGTYPNFTITGTEVDGSITNELQTLSTGTNSLTLSGGGGTVTVDTDPASDVTGSGTSGQVSYWNGTQTQTGSSSLLYNDTQKSLTLTNSTQSGIPRGWLMQQTTGDGAGNLFIMQKSRAGAITSGTTIGVWDAEGFDGSDYQKSSRITFTSSGTIGAGAVPGTISFVTANSSGTLTTRTTLDHLGVFNHLGSAAIGASFAPAANLHVRGSGTSSSTWTAQFHNSAGNNNALMIRDDGNVGIGTNSPGAKLQVNGSTSDNAATALRASNSINQNLFDVRNDGQLGIGTLNFWYSYNDATGVATRVATGGLMRISYGATGATGSGYGLFVANGQITNRDYTSGDGGGFRLGEGYAPTSGTGTYNSFLIGGTINQTGGANGITRGILISPTLTSAADYRAIQFNNNSGWGIYGAGTAKSYFAGNVAIGTTSQNASSAFEVASTTQGVLFPRMTTTQRNAIASPAAGLTIYNTTDGVMQHYNGSTWTDERDNVNGLSGLGVTNYLAQYNSSNTLDTTGVIWTGGRLGIGTATPSARLNVQGTTADHGVSTNIGYNVTTVTAPVLNQASVVVSAGGSMTPGTHHFKVTYYNAFGGTEGSNTISAVTDTINKTVTFDLPVSTNPTVVGRRIYKSIVPQNASYGTLIATIANNTATSFTYSSIDPIPNPVNTNPVAAIPNLTSNYFTKDGIRSFVISNSLVSVGPFANSNLVAGPNVALTTGNAFNSGISIANNVTIGSPSQYLTTGAGNVVVGYDALATGTTTSYNVAIGQFALNKTQSSERHVGIGYSALNSVTSGQYNVAIGMLSGNNMTTGSNNTFLGSTAGSTFTGGSALTSVNNSIFLGYNSAAFANSTSYETVIGVGIVGLGSNKTRIGSGSNTNQTHLDGRLTIGNTFYDSRVAARIVGADASSTNYSLVVTDSDGGTSTTVDPNFVVRNDGLVGIGTYSPGAKLQINGSGNTNASTALIVQNSDAINMFRVRNDGLIQLGSNGNIGLLVNDNGSNTSSLSGVSVRFNHAVSSESQTGFIFKSYFDSMNATSGTQTNASFSQGFRPTSGTAVFNQLSLNFTVDQTGGANGITRGLYVQPNLISAADWRSIEWSNSSGYGLYGAGTAPNLLNGRLFIPTGSYDNPSLSFVNDANTGLYRPLEDNLELKTGTNNAIVLENQSTNLKINSENLTIGANTQNITVTNPGTITAPDGTTTGNLAVPNTTSAQHRFFYIITVASPHTMSVYAKAAGYNFISMGIGGGVEGAGIIFNLSNGTITGTVSGFSATIENVGNGWYRCALTRTGTGVSASLSRFIIVRNDATTNDYVGDGTSGVQLWGFQIEESLAATSYIKTEASAVTRNQGVSILGPNVYGNLITKNITAPSLQNLSFLTSNTERVTITPTGSVGIGSTAPARTLHVAGEVRITDLSTDTPTKLVGADADGDLDDVVLGEGLTLSSGVLDVSSSAAVLASEVVIEGSTATTIDLDVSGNVKTIDGGNATFVYPSNLARLSVYKNGVRLTRTGSLTTRDFTVNTTTNEITFSTPLVSTDRIVIVKL